MGMSIQQAERWRKFIEAAIVQSVCANDKTCSVAEYDHWKKQKEEVWDEIYEKL